MEATTIKIEDPLLGELKRRVDKNKSISSYIREILEKEMRRQKMMEAAAKYNDFLAQNPTETEWLKEWEEAPLHQKPVTKK